VTGLFRHPVSPAHLPPPSTTTFPFPYTPLLEHTQDYCPAEVDFTLQSPDVWFWKDGTSLKSLATLAKIYHASAGRSR
jgi:hypothetical protein